jgi:hypothetical protein
MIFNFPKNKSQFLKILKKLQFIFGKLKIKYLKKSAGARGSVVG